MALKHCYCIRFYRNWYSKQTAVYIAYTLAKNLAFSTHPDDFFILLNFSSKIINITTKIVISIKNFLFKTGTVIQKKTQFTTV